MGPRCADWEVTKMQTSTNSKKKYIKAWESHVDDFQVLRFTPSKELSEEVNEEIKKFKHLINRVAEDKGLK